MNKKATKILMVCLGNICRSPMAEGLMRHKINKLKLNAIVDSAGVANYHIGDNPDRRAIKIMKDNNIDISYLKGRQFNLSDFENFDIIFIMDDENYDDILSLTNNKDYHKKVFYILNPLLNINKPLPDLFMAILINLKKFMRV